MLVIFPFLFSTITISTACVATPSSLTPCQSCAASLITITTAGNGAHAMDGDVIDRTTTCATRTLTCLGINNGFGVVMDGDDGTVDGRTTFVVTCNTAGTAWINSGVTIAQLECASNVVG